MVRKLLELLTKTGEALKNLQELKHQIDEISFKLFGMSFFESLSKAWEYISDFIQ